MQLTNFLAIIALTVTGAVAAPGGSQRVAPAPLPAMPKPNINFQPVISNQVNYCSSGSPYCCTPDVTEGGSGTTCKLSTTQCNAVAICCNNVQGGNAPSSQTCTTALITTIPASSTSDPESAIATLTEYSVPSNTADYQTSRPRPAQPPTVSTSPSSLSSKDILAILGSLAALLV